MAKTTNQPPDKGTVKPATPTKSTPNSPRVISRQVFNDFAAI
ncbi:MAG: hypothetical protein RIG84_07490 [Roseovarius sp.]